MEKEIRLNIRVTAKEKAKYQEEADKLGITLTNYVKLKLNNKLKK